ncbi:TOBE domain-containing protein [Microbispora sp. GKU 823]|uniref:TOBE domain-containing protein n=1 Tax=Microbispora sp. GKU 823 TaxID=1652100 RepID=UPI00211895CB|nr:TOBE domain-containing protein [Microbispora sp. GKU 823]
MNHLPGLVSGDRVTVLGQTLPVEGQAPDTAQADVLVRPEAVLVTPDAEGDGIVMVSSFRGSTARLRVRLGDGTEVLADVPGHDSARFAPGTAVRIGLVERPVLVSARSETGAAAAVPEPDVV